MEGQNLRQLQYLRTKIGVNYNFQDIERPNHLESVCSLYNALPKSSKRDLQGVSVISFKRDLTTLYASAKLTSSF